MSLPRLDSQRPLLHRPFTWSGPVSRRSSEQIQVDSLKARQWMLKTKWSSTKTWMLAGCCTWWYQQVIDDCWDVLENRIEHAKKIDDVFSENNSMENQDNESGTNDVEDLVTGPAVKWAWIANIVTWIGFVDISVLSAFYTHIDNEAGVPHTLVGWNFGFLAILFWWLFTTIVPIMFEFRAALYVLPAQACAMGEPGFFLGIGKGRLTFLQYLSILLLISFILHTDIFTTAMFVGRVFKSTHSCHGSSKHWSFSWFLRGDPESPLEKIWRESSKKSFSGPIHAHLHMTLWSWTLLSWIIMLYQLCYAVVYAMPTSPDFHNEYSERICRRSLVCCRRYQLVTGSYTYHDLATPEECPRRRALYHTVGAPFTSHGRCLQALGDSGRMMSIQWLDDDYCEQAAQEWKLEKIVAQMGRANWRFAFFALQAISMLHVQVFFYGAQKHLLSSATGVYELVTDGFTTLSVCISVLFGFKYIAWEMKTLWRSWTRLDTAIADEKQRHGNTKNNLKKWDIITQTKRGYCNICVGLCFSVVFSVTFAFFSLEIFMEMESCDNGVWIADWSTSRGCLSSDMRSMGWTGNWSTAECKTGLEFWADQVI